MAEQDARYFMKTLRKQASSMDSSLKLDAAMNDESEERVPRPPRLSSKSGNEAENKFQVGEKVTVVKAGSSKWGSIAIVTQSNWNGMVKVELNGATKSYWPKEIEKVDEDEMHAAKEKEQDKGSRRHPSILQSSGSFRLLKEADLQALDDALLTPQNSADALKSSLIQSTMNQLQVLKQMSSSSFVQVSQPHRTCPSPGWSFTAVHGSDSLVCSGMTDAQTEIDELVHRVDDLKDIISQDEEEGSQVSELAEGNRRHPSILQSSGSMKFLNEALPDSPDGPGGCKRQDSVHSVKLDDLDSLDLGGGSVQVSRQRRDSSRSSYGRQSSDGSQSPCTVAAPQGHRNTVAAPPRSGLTHRNSEGVLLGTESFFLRNGNSPAVRARTASAARERDDTPEEMVTLSTNIGLA